jgi:hypothetical protein
MTRLPTLLLASWLFPATAIAATALDGTWKEDLSTAKFSGKPIVLSLKKGTYQCVSCVPPEQIKADGKPHKLTGDPYDDSGLAAIISPTEVDITLGKAGKTQSTLALTVSADGNTLTWKGTDSSASSGAPVAFDYSGKRVGKAPAGSHAIAGSWVLATAAQSENGLIVTYKSAGDTLTMTSPTGQSYSATIGGPQAPFKGDPGISTVAIKKIDDHTYQETDYRDGKVIYVGTTTVAPGGKAAQVVGDNPLNGFHFEVTENKQ